ncbi:MAG: hypothetical protein K8T25_09155 [Planctomycetia bacterium]|nr:hypothetical protein [Planctomycetia bacterium]
MKRIGRIQFATLAVILAGIVARAFWNGNIPLSYSSLGCTIYFGLLFAELMLLGIWGAIGTSVSEWRLVGVVMGLVAVSVVYVAGFGNKSFGLHTLGALVGVVAMSLPTYLVIVVVGMYRVGRMRLHRFTDGHIPGVVGNWQFSIRRMLVVTAAVAALCGLTRVLLVAAFNEREMANFLTALTMTCAGYPAIALAIVWACLGLGRLGPRLAVAAAIAAICGLLPLLIVDDRFMWASHLIVLAIAVSVVTGHLLVVRSAGYRFVPLAEQDILPASLFPHPGTVTQDERKTERPAPITSSESSPPADRRM